MKINVTPQLAVDALTGRFYRQLAQQVNALSEGKAAALYQSAQSVPTTGTFAQGDFVTNNNPIELGTAGSKYVIRGFICIAGGTPGTFVQCRYLTGA
jgi:hypothetical protein